MFCYKIKKKLGGKLFGTKSKKRKKIKVGKKKK